MSGWLEIGIDVGLEIKEEEGREGKGGGEGVYREAVGRDGKKL